MQNEETTGRDVHGQHRRRFRGAFPTLLTATFLAGCAGLSDSLPNATRAAEGIHSTDKEALWNDSKLIQWVADLADDERRYGALETVQSFERLQATIEEVKQLVLMDAESEQDAIEGLRMILKHLASSTHDSLNTDDHNPLFAKQDPRDRSIGAYNPDAEYDQASIDGRFDSKLTGRLGSVPYVSVTINGQTDGQFSQNIAFLDDTEIRKHAAPDGSFALWLTKEKPDADGGWVRLPDSANGVAIRQYVADREQDELASIAIETASAIGASAANKANDYQMAYYEIDDGEMLLIDFEPPSGIDYWNLISATIWHESHRYRTDPVSLTSREVERQENGHVRFVLAREDPGHPNWIRTFAHDRGFLIFRMPGVSSHPVPNVERIPATRLEAVLLDRSIER